MQINYKENYPPIFFVNNSKKVLSCGRGFAFLVKYYCFLLQSYHFLSV